MITRPLNSYRNKLMT